RQNDAADKSKTFIWPDKAVLLLIEMYREKEVEFSSGFKCSNKIWVEIAAEMNETNPIYDITAMDSLFGDKASIRPPAIASSEGPLNPNQEESSSEKIVSSHLQSLPRKRQRIENVIETFLNKIETEKEERKEEMKKREIEKDKIREENKKEREKRHNEQMAVQKSLVSILQQFLTKM
ncbi:uncharacterized protein, partial [Mycetomoellerius zeteki]|uniref:uncharacterized protein n=1 Tax=Mycetomoellerius zeteki TaxID=64791 RepID=UPI00084E6D4B